MTRFVRLAWNGGWLRLVPRWDAWPWFFFFFFLVWRGWVWDDARDGGVRLDQFWGFGGFINTHLHIHPSATPFGNCMYLQHLCTQFNARTPTLGKRGDQGRRGASRERGIAARPISPEHHTQSLPPQLPSTGCPPGLALRCSLSWRAGGGLSGLARRLSHKRLGRDVVSTSAPFFDSCASSFRPSPFLFSLFSFFFVLCLLYSVIPPLGLFHIPCVWLLSLVGILRVASVQSCDVTRIHTHTHTPIAHHGFQQHAQHRRRP